MMDFAAAWPLTEVGVTLTAADGSPEPPRDDIRRWARWRQTNFTGTVVEKEPNRLVVSVESETGTSVFVLTPATETRFEFPSPTLALAQTLKWGAVKAKRREVENGLAPTPFGAVQCDESSKLKITGLVNMASIAKAAGAPMQEQFTLADNTVVTLDADGVIGLAVAVGQFISAVYAHARALRQAIFSESLTAEELEAIDIETGWPA